VGDREGHRKVSAHGVTDQIDALSFDALGKVQNPVGGGAAIVDAAVVDAIAQPASGTVRDDHMPRGSKATKGSQSPAWVMPP